MEHPNPHLTTSNNNVEELATYDPSLQQLMVKDTSEHTFLTRSKKLNLCLSAETQEEPHSKRLTTALLKSSNDRTNTSHSGLETSWIKFP
jgi:hypothetical protein